MLRKWKQQGVHIGDPDAARLLPVDAPCYRDIKNGIDYLAESIAGNERNENYQKVQDAKEKDEFIVPRDERAWKIISEAITMLTEERNLMKAFFHNDGYTFGKVFAASGLREVPSTKDPKEDSIRDWALVKPNENRSVGNNYVSTPPLDLLPVLNSQF